MCSRIEVEKIRRARGSGSDVGLTLKKIVRPTLATVLAVILVVSVVLTVSSPPRVSAVVPGANGKIAFASNRDGNSEIYVMNADGSGQTRLTNNAASDDYPAWSPDGTKIAFMSGRDGNAEIYVMNANGSGQTNLTNNAATDEFPAWSPDGSKIAFDSARDGNWEIYVMNADGSAPIRLTNNAPVSDYDPAWSPDGSKIAFVSTPGGNPDIYVMNADGSGQTRLTNNAAADESPAWSFDSAKIAFQSNRDGNDEIYWMNANGSGQTNLTNNANADRFPAWSPDGYKIAFESERGTSQFQIYVMNADGSGQTELTSTTAPNFDPDWQSVPQLASLLLFSDLPEGSILMVIGDLALNPHGNKPSGVNYQQGRDTTPLGYLRGMVSITQQCVFDTNAAINATNGRPIGDWPLIFSIGGSGINAVTHYYEGTSNAFDQAPIKFGYDGTDFYWMFSRNGTEVPGSRVAQSSTAVPPGTSDVFVIQILRDADGRLVVLMYGTRYTGTWAAAEYFKFHVYSDINAYTSSYYIVRWTDATSGTSANSMPDSRDTFTILAQG